MRGRRPMEVELARGAAAAATLPVKALSPSISHSAGASSSLVGLDLGERHRDQQQVGQKQGQRADR